MRQINSQKARWLAGCLVAFTLLAFTFAAAAADEWKCVICGKPITGEYFKMVDRVTGETNRVCEDCSHLEHCFECGLPVKPGEGLHFKDGRVLCARDSHDVISTEEGAKEVCRDTKYDLDRLFSRYMTFPGDNVEISIVDQMHLNNLFHSPGFREDGNVYGATASNPMPGKKLEHTIDLLSNLRKPQLMAVCAHEYTHTWLNENLSHLRQATIDRDAIEGFCELIAYKYMESRQETREMEDIKKNAYTHGEIIVLIAADDRYGFNTICEWMLHGTDTRLDRDNLDRVRAVQDEPYSPQKPPSAALAPLPVVAPTIVPDTLVLKGISGTEQHRFALINNATFELMEKGKVRVGQTNLNIQVIEIRADSVTIQADGSKEKQQLFLRAKP